MKKSGFTLAEVLITLGIIGIIAALTMPTFTQNTQKAKVAPRLSKAVSMFEQATHAVLDDAQSDSINGAQVKCADSDTETASLTSSTACFYNNLTHHLKGSYSGDVFTTNDGMSYEIKGGFTGTEGLYAHNTLIAGGGGHDANTYFMIDINNVDTAPNAPARDRFYFYMMDDGTLNPLGGAYETEEDNKWQTKCPVNETPVDPDYCAGHVLENNLRIEYK